MNKVLRIVFLISTIILNIICFKVKLLGLTSWGHVLYFILMIILVIITIKDLLRKEKINDNSIYNWISIFIFVIMDYIILRTLLDKNLFFNNKELITEYNRYMKILYPEVIPYNFREFAMYYFRQNMLYFNSMLLLLFSYRKLNKNKEKN